MSSLLHGSRAVPDESPDAPLRESGAAACDLLSRAEGEERQGRRAVARSLYEQALMLGGRTLSPEQAVDALCGVARTWQLDADSAAALDTLTVAEHLAGAASLDGALGRVLNVRAVVHWQQGDLDAADALYVSAHRCATRAGDGRLAAMTAQNRGIIANVRGDLPQALRHYRDSLDAYRRLGLTREVCGALNNLGMLHTDLGEWREAELAYGEALQLAEAEGEDGARLLILVNQAELALAHGNVDEARAICARALPLARAQGDERAEGELRKHLGVIARETGHHARAERQFAMGDRLAARRQDVLLLAELARENAELLGRLGRFRETVHSLNRAHQLFGQLRARRDLADLDRRTSRLEVGFLEVVRRWGESIESKDAYTQGHCVRVADLACALARRVGFDARRMFWFRVGALLHDVGKIDIPAEILNKPGRLTAEEWALMRAHPEAGVELLKGIDFPEDVIPLVLHHHEKWDGSGYPHGLAGDAIPLVARILGLADVYDALVTDRSYKPGMPHAAAVALMARDAGTHFDPELMPLFVEVVDDRAREDAL